MKLKKLQLYWGKVWAELCTLLLNIFEKLYLINSEVNLRPPQHLNRNFLCDISYCHKEIYYRYCRGPRYTSETGYYKKFENEEDNVRSNKNLVKQFSGGWAFFRRAIFSGAFFRTTCTIYDTIIYWLHFTIKEIPVKHAPPKSISTRHLPNSEVDLGLLPEPRWRFLR